jgi:hypothetical protein
MCITCLRFLKEVGGEGGGKELNLTLAQVHLSSLLFSFLGFLSRQHYHYRAGGSVIIGLAAFSVLPCPTG